MKTELSKSDWWCWYAKIWWSRKGVRVERQSWRYVCKTGNRVMKWIVQHFQFSFHVTFPPHAVNVWSLCCRRVDLWLWLWLSYTRECHWIVRLAFCEWTVLLRVTCRYCKQWESRTIQDASGVCRATGVLMAYRSPSTLKTASSVWQIITGLSHVVAS